MENKDASSGQVRGRYGYTDPDGKLRLTYYTAGPQGFNVVPDTSKPTSAAPSYRTDSHTTTTVVEAPLVRVDHHPVPLPVHDVPVSHLSRPISPCTINKPPCPRGMLSRKEFLDENSFESLSCIYIDIDFFFEKFLCIYSCIIFHPILDSYYSTTPSTTTCG